MPLAFFDVRRDSALHLQPSRTAMPSFRQTCAIALLSAVAITSHAAPINQILYGSLTGRG